MPLPSAIPDPSQKEYDEIPLIAGGEYPAKLIKVEEKPNNFNPDQPQLLWSWRITHPDLLDHPLWQYTSQKMGAFEEKDTQTGKSTVKKSGARMNLEALLQRELAPGEELDWENDVFGREAILSVIRKINQAGEMRNKVVAVLPISMVAQTTKGNVRPLLSTDVTKPAGTGTATSAALPEELGYIRRFEQARAILNWDPGQMIDTIVAVVGLRKPFHLLDVSQQKEVLAILEPEAEKTDVPFDPVIDDDELAAAGMPAMPKSTKHRVA